MARWLQETVQGMLNPELADTSIPVVEAEFSKSGDPRYFWTERVVSYDEVVELTWHNCGEPLLIHTQPNAVPGRKYGVCTVLIPAHGARQIGRAHVSTPVTNAHLVCRLLLDKQKKSQQHTVVTH